MTNGADHDNLTRMEVKLDHVVEKVDQLVGHHETMWKVVNQHSRQIATWRGMLMAVTGALAIAWADIKGIFGGGTR